mmetsp:Transcript_19588/g.35955  ORF Transcript_19588/g.35955 Transcript_19588/m.35955 type:complete len:163 (-) Transcript_19588:3313-3801(-)
MSEGTAEYTHLYNFPFKIVARAYLNKYPHPDLNHVESVDTLERYVDENGVLHTTRVLTTSFLKFSSVAGFEQSTIDLLKNLISLKTKSLNYTSFARSYEECIYMGEGPDKTKFEIRGDVWIATGFGFLMKSALNTFCANFKKGTEALEDIIQSHKRLMINLA